jgi:hypothetical protein
MKGEKSSYIRLYCNMYQYYYQQIAERLVINNRNLHWNRINVPFYSGDTKSKIDFYLVRQFYYHA